eukprot:gene5657-6080_t
MSEDHYLLKAYRRSCRRNRGWKVDQQHGLAKLLNQLPQELFLNGEFQNKLSRSIPLTLKHPDPLTGQLRTINAGTLASPNVDVLLEHARDSSFGRGSATVYDENVRRGKELTAEQLELGEVEGPKGEKMNMNSLIEGDILSTLSKDFLRGEVEVKFYKLAIYEPGGHFQVHRDTVHDPEHKATLLVEVYSEHRGGKLVLEKDGKRVDWILSSNVKRKKEENEDEPMLRWCLFYTDVEHQVETVTAGVRMVLQFDVLVHPEIEDNNQEARQNLKVIINNDKDKEVEYHTYDTDDSDSEYPDIFKNVKPVIHENRLIQPQTNVLQQIRAQLKEIVTEEHAIAIPLYYLYTSETIKPESLKNYDYNLLRGLLEGGDYKIAIEPIELTTYYNPDDHNYPRDVDINLHDFPWTLYSMDSSTGELSTSVLEGWVEWRSLTYVYTGKESLVKFHFQDYIEHTGNEAQLAENHYLCGALIIMKV